MESSWKRAEFLAKEMKEFFDNARVQNAPLLIDWGTRWIRLLDDSESNRGNVVVTRQFQRYTPAEAAIRDCYDAFLDGLERFSSYVQTGLINVRQLRPYL